MGFKISKIKQQHYVAKLVNAVNNQIVDLKNKPATQTAPSEAGLGYVDAPTVSAESASENEVLPVKNPPYQAKLRIPVADLISAGKIPLIQFGFTGIDSVRPDIVSLADFNPAYSKQNSSSPNEVAALLDIQHNIRQVTQEVLEDFIKKAKNDQNLEELLSITKASFKQNIKNTKAYLNALNVIFTQFDNLDSALNIKENKYVSLIKPELDKYYTIDKEWEKAHTTKIVIQALYEFFLNLKYGKIDKLLESPYFKADRSSLEGMAPLEDNIRRSVLEISRDTMAFGTNFENDFVRVANGNGSGYGYVLDSITSQLVDFSNAHPTKNNVAISSALILFLNDEMYCSTSLGKKGIRDFISDAVPTSFAPLDPNETRFDKVVNFSPVAEYHDFVNVQVGDNTFISNFATKTNANQSVLTLESTYIAESDKDQDAGKPSFKPSSVYAYEGLMHQFKFDTTKVDLISTKVSNIKRRIDAVKKMFSTNKLFQQKFDTSGKAAAVDTTSKQIEKLIFNEHKSMIKRLSNVSFAKIPYDPVNNSDSKLIREFGLLSLLDSRTNPDITQTTKRRIDTLTFDLIAPEFDNTGTIIDNEQISDANLQEINKWLNDALEQILKATGKEFTHSTQTIAIVGTLFTKELVNQEIEAKGKKNVIFMDAYDPTLLNEFTQIKQSILSVFTKFKSIIKTSSGYNNNETRCSSLNDRTIYTIIYYIYMDLLAHWNPMKCRWMRHYNVHLKSQGSKFLPYESPGQYKSGYVVAFLKMSDTSDNTEYDVYFNTLNKNFSKAINGFVFNQSTEPKLVAAAKIVKATKRIVEIRTSQADRYSSLWTYFNCFSDYFNKIDNAIAKIKANAEIINGTVPLSATPIKGKNKGTITASAAIQGGLSLDLGASVHTANNINNQQKLFQELTKLINSNYAVMYNRQQLKLANKALDLLESKIDDSSNVFVDESIMTKDIQNALHSMLKNNTSFGRFLEDDTKILTVGIPNGFSNHLQKNIKLVSAYKTDSIDVSKQQDLVQIKVYKQNVQYSKLIFKPKIYDFELSRFCLDSIKNNKSIFELQNRETPFQKIVDEMFLTFNYDKHSDIIDNEKGYSKKNMEPGKELDEDGYSILGTFQKKYLRRNHIISHLLSWYMKYLIGIDFDESRFTVAQEYNTNNTLQDDSLMSELATRFELSDEQASYIKLFSSKTILKAGLTDQINVLSPKKYERIFNIPINPNDFVIDETKTNSTLAGASQLVALENSTLQKNIQDGTHIHGNGIIKQLKYHRDDIHLLKYWVVITSIT
jgi:hypothetical protein